MIQPIKMKPQSSTNFSGFKKSYSDPLNARNAYSKVLEDNEDVLKLETAKFKKGNSPHESSKINFKA